MSSVQAVFDQLRWEHLLGLKALVLQDLESGRCELDDETRERLLEAISRHMVDRLDDEGKLEEVDAR